MRKLINISFSPNTRRKDLLANLTLFSFTWYLEKVEKLFEQKFSGSRAFTFNYARSGLYVLLKSLKLESNDEVLALGFTCIAATNPIVWAGAKVKYVKVDPATLNFDLADLKANISQNTKAILFQHTFGNSRGIDEVVQLCKEHNVLLIEDCANTTFGLHKGKMLGSFGDASIFSFGRDKPFSGVSGGLVLINNLELFDSFDKEYRKCRSSNENWEFQQFVYPIVWAFIKFIHKYTPGKLWMVFHKIFEILGLLVRPNTKGEKLGKRPKYIPALMANRLAKLAYVQLLDADEINEHRKMITGIYRSSLSTFSYEEGNVLLRFPIFVEKKEELLKFMRANDVYLGDWFSLNDACITDMEISKKVVNLPTHINVTQEDAYNIIRLLQEFNAG